MVQVAAKAAVAAAENSAKKATTQDTTKAQKQQNWSAREWLYATAPINSPSIAPWENV